MSQILELRQMTVLREIYLTIHAARLVRRAQAVLRGQPVPATLEEMCRTAGLPRSVDEIEAHRAISRAAHRLSQVGLTNTCLIRSLGLAALLADRENVQLHLGFSPSADLSGALKGHAWVSLDTRVLPDDSATHVEGVPTAEIASLRARR